MVVNAILVGLVAFSIWNAFWIDATANRVLRHIPRPLLPEATRAIRHRIYFAVIVSALIVYRVVGG